VHLSACQSSSLLCLYHVACLPLSSVCLSLVCLAIHVGLMTNLLFLSLVKSTFENTEKQSDSFKNRTREEHNCTILEGRCSTTSTSNRSNPTEEGFRTHSTTSSHNLGPKKLDGMTYKESLWISSILQPICNPNSTFTDSAGYPPKHIIKKSNRRTVSVHFALKNHRIDHIQNFSTCVYRQTDRQTERAAQYM
jgi:hypothetical protein